MKKVSISGSMLRLLLLLAGITSLASLPFLFGQFGQVRIWTAPVIVSDTTLPGNALRNHISAARDGSLLLLWEQDFHKDAPPDAIYLRESSSQFFRGNWSVPQRLPVADSSRYPQEPRGLKDHSGIVHAFWGERFAPRSPRPTQPPTDIMYSYRDRAGKWSQPISLFHSSDRFPWSDEWLFPVIRRDAQDRIHLIWEVRDSTEWFLLYKRKDGNGWTDTKKLPIWAGDFDFTIDSKGRLHLVAIVPHVRYSFSTDAGQTWPLPPVLVATQGLGEQIAIPGIVVGRDDRIHILWGIDYNGDLFSDDILHSHSSDGVHWSQPVNVASVEGIKLRMTPVIDDRNNIHLFFHAQKFPPFQLPHKLYYAQWDGQSWTLPVMLFENAALRTVAIDSSQSLHLVWGHLVDYPYNSRWINLYSHTNSVTSVPEVVPQTPREFLLLQNYPNPFNITTRIEYHLPQSSSVTLELYDTAGRLIKTLVGGNHPAGVYQVMLDGGELASGTYIYRLKAGNFSESKKMILLK